MQPPPYPSYPHQPAPPHALPAAPQRPPLNGLAVAALVTGLLCMVPVVGVVLGVIALVQIKRTGARGKGMAVTGLVLSAVGTLLCTLVLVGGAGAFVKGFKEGAREGARDGGAFSLRRGECFDTPGGGLQAPAADMDTVPCAQRHTAEVVGTFRLPGPQAYPGDAALRDRVEDRCQRLADGYAMDAWAVPADVKVYYYAPDRETWKLGDREVTCVFGKEKGTLKGTLRQDASTLDAHQVAYLEAANALNEAMAGGRRRSTWRTTSRATGSGRRGHGGPRRGGPGAAGPRLAGRRRGTGRRARGGGREGARVLGRGRRGEGRGRLLRALRGRGRAQRPR